MEDYYMGEVIQFAFDFAPPFYLLCDGAAYSIQKYRALFGVIGTTYGGDGVTTFKVPDLTSAETLPGMKYYICDEGDFPKMAV